MTHSTATMSTQHPQVITATLVSEEARIDFFEKYFKSLALSFERDVFDIARGTCSDYSGDIWDFYELSNGGCFMALDKNKQFQVKGFHGYSTQLNGMEFGIYCSKLALSWNFCDHGASLYYSFLSDLAGSLIEFCQGLDADRVQEIKQLF